MRKFAYLGIVIAVVVLAAAIWLWWSGGASQLGDFSTRGLVRAGGFLLFAVVLHAVAAWVVARSR